MTVPYWVQDAIFYQIFPDRFASHAAASSESPGRLPWGSPPDPWTFQGGDLRGIIEKFDYLLDLGINAIYLNPIFLSPSNHRYNTVDYYRIDPRLGDLRDFKALLDLAHANRVRLILDGVFNHCSRGFFAFVDLLENEAHSSYRDWFHVRRFPLDAYSPGPAENYLGWWDLKSLPKFNTDSPAVRRYLINVGRYWIEQGIDGWRLDVPNEIDDDSFWQEFRQVVKSANPDAYLTGEIWTADRRWVGEGHFDGLMNYPLRDAVIGFLNGGELKAAGFAEKVENLLEYYPRENAYAMYQTLGTHDTERLVTALHGKLDKIKLAFAFLFAYPGAPAVYYGDEIGMSGGKDPESRGAFPWDPEEWIEELRGWVKTLIAVRKRTPALRRGGYRRVLADDGRGCYAFLRTLGDQPVLAALNAGPARRSLRLKVEGTGWQDGRIVRNLLGGEEALVSGDSLVISLSGWSGAWYA